MSEIVVLKKIDFDPDPEMLFKKFRFQREGPDGEILEALLGDALDIARPKGMYRVAFVDEKSEDFVTLDEVTLDSRVMRINLDKTQRAFPMIATCGSEIAEWSRGITDMLQRFWVDMIMEEALKRAGATVLNHIRERFEIENISYMSPGSIADWPLSQQRGLFQLLGDPEKEIGVKLTESFLMIPTKTVSRLAFPSDERYENCQLCPRKGHCPSRRAPFDPDLYARKYLKR